MLANLKIICLIFFIIINFLSFGQRRDITVNQLNVNEGLAQSTITSLKIDDFNQVWVGSYGGINKIENNIACDILDNSFFESIAIRSIWFDKNQNLMLGTENGAYLFKDKKIENIKIEQLHQTDKLLQYYSVGNYQLFFTRENKIAILKNQEKIPKIIEFKSPIKVEDISIHNEVVYWITEQPYKLMSFDSRNGKISSYLIPRNQTPISVQAINNEVIISTQKSILIFNPQTNKWLEHDISNIVKTVNPSFRIKFIKRDFQMNYWIGMTGFGLIVLNKYFDVLHYYSGIYINANGENFNLELPTEIEFDLSGNAFIGTDGNGLIKINPKIRKFNHLIPSSIEGSKLKDNFITAVYESKDRILYFGTLNDGISIFNESNNLYKNIQFPKNANNTISIIYFINDYSNNLLIVGTNQGLFTLDAKNKLNKISENPKNSTFNLIEKFDENFYFLGSSSGIFTLINNQLKKVNTKSIDQISILKKIDNKTILIAEKGLGVFLMKFSKTDTVLEEIKIEGLNSNTKPSFSSFIKHKDYYYLGSSFGLIKFDRSFKQIKIYNQNNGLPNYHIYSLESDLDSQIWIGTNRGLSSFCPQTEKFHHFTTHDGIQSNEFNSNASYKAFDGKLIFGGVNGINIFYPKSILFNQNKPKIILSDILLFDNQSIIKDDLNEYSLKHFQNNLSFIITVSENSIPEKNQLKIKIKGIDREWILLKNRRLARYPFLPPGEYEVWAMASNNDDIWTEPHLLVCFKIMPPFYKSLWFIILTSTFILFLLSIIFYLIYLRNLKKKIIEMKQLQEIEKVRLNISREIHDDIGSGLTQIVMISEQILNENQSINELSFLGKKLIKLTSISRELIQSMGEIVWYINPSNDSFENLLIYIRITINRLIEESTFDITFNFPTKTPELIINADARRKLALIVKEAVNNSIKYSKGNLIHIQMEIFNTKYFKLLIADNGKGFEKPANELGNGLRNMKQNAEELTLDFDIKSDNSGTIITITGDIEKITTKR